MIHISSSLCRIQQSLLRNSESFSGGQFIQFSAVSRAHQPRFLEWCEGLGRAEGPRREGRRAVREHTAAPSLGEHRGLRRRAPPVGLRLPVGQLAPAHSPPPFSGPLPPAPSPPATSITSCPEHLGSNFADLGRRDGHRRIEPSLHAVAQSYASGCRAAACRYRNLDR